MRKILINLLVFMLLCGSSVMAQFNGSGTSSDPYLISSEQDLYNLTTAVNQGNSFSGNFFKQTTDLDFVDSQVFPNGFTPIGNYGRNRPFSGTYDGDGHSISKLYVAGNDDAGMFGYIKDACIKNLNFENANIVVNAVANVAVAVAHAENSTVLNITASGQIKAVGDFDGATLSGIVGVSVHSTISGCVSMLSFDVEEANTNTIQIAGIAQADATISNCLVSTFIKGTPQRYFPIGDEATISKCVVVESNGIQSDVHPTYRNCYFDHQNTNLAEFPYQQTYIDGFFAKPTATMTSGSLLNDENWLETPGLYPRPAAVANNNVAILAASPMTLNSADCINSVVSNFTVSTANNVTWATESNYLQISGGDASIVNAVDSLVEIYAFRNANVKNIQIRLSDNALGSKANPYRISSEDDFMELANLLSSDGIIPNESNFDLEQDRELYFLVDSDFTITNLLPIGINSPFRWNFDGGNHTITVEQMGDYDYNIRAGLFGLIVDATISNLTVVYNNVSTDYINYWGGIAAYAENSVIYNCKTMGYIEDIFSPEDLGFFGGIVAHASKTLFYKCVNMAELNLQSASVGITTGGIVGYGDSIAMRSCTNFGYIHGYPDQGEVGGLIGEASSSEIVSCANYADLEATGYNPGAFVGAAYNSTISDCANYSGKFMAFARRTEESTYTNNVNVPSGASAELAYDSFIDGLISLNNLTNGGTGDKKYNICSNNYTDKQIVPLSGNSMSIKGVLTSELMSGNVDLDPVKWIFSNSGYPIPVGTDIDADIVKLATTPICFAANNADDFQTIKTVKSNFELPSVNGISWMLDSVTLTSSTVDVESLRQDSIAVSLSLVSSIGENHREYAIVIPARVGSPENPLLIESVSDFIEFAQAFSANTNTATYKGMAITNLGHGLNFKLTTDISSTSRINRPSSFSGNFNGGGHTITVKQTDLVSNSICGLFPTISCATIDSLNVETNGAISASNVQNYASILCTQATNSTISNCTVTINGDFSGTDGAVVCASTENSTIINCSTNGSGTVTLGSDYSGGVVCYSKNSRIINCTNNVKVQPNSCYKAGGGIVAYGYSLILENCVNNGNIILNEQSYAAGIVGELSDDGSNSQNIIRTSVNNGYIYANNSTGGQASGILGDSGQAKVNIEKCMNSGTISGMDYASGIAGDVNGSVSNCANYGSVQCEEDVTGIAQRCSSMTGNIVAYRPSYSPDPYNYNTQDVISPDADEDDFFDEQITEIKVDSLRLGFYDHGTPRTTQMMVGNALANDLPGDWDFTDGLYPLPAGIDPNDERNKLARLPIILNSAGVGRSERITAVISDITLPQVDGVTWESSNPDVVSVPSGGGVATVTNPTQDAQVTITATCGDFTRSYTIKVCRAYGLSADNPIIITSCRDILYEMCQNENYPSGGYGFYFKLGDDVRINKYDIHSDAEANFHVNQANLNVMYPSNYPFRGHFDGDGHSIIWQNTGFQGDYYGLFNYTDGAEISNLTMYYNDNGAYNRAGTLVGNAKATTIRNCAVYSNLSVSDRVGGIVDVASDGTVISNCMFVGEISAKNIGGIVAKATDTRISNSISMLRKSPEGDVLETGGAIVLSAKNVTVDSCLVVGDNYYGRINVVSASNESVSASNCYYDKQMWIPSDGDTINNIGVTTRELIENGLFNWSHSEGRYPIPAGTETLSPATLVATPMLIGANDDVMNVTELGISNDDDVQWAVNNTNAIVGYSVGCVDEPASAEIVATYSDGTLSDQALDYNFTRDIIVTKGVVEVNLPDNIGLVCEGGQFNLSVNNGSALSYAWNIPEGLTADAYDTESITVHVDDNYLRDNNPEPISVIVSFDGCDVTREIEFTAIPSPSHFRVNDTSVCTGSDLSVICQIDDGYDEYVNNFFLKWYDASNMNNLLMDDTVGATGYYIPILTEDRNLRILAMSREGDCADTLNVAMSVNPISPITVVSGEPNQWICQGEFMEPIVLSVEKPTYYLPEGVYAEYNDDEAQLTLSGRPFYSSQNDYSYTIYGCGSTYNGEIVVWERTRIYTDGSFSQVLNLGDELDDIRLEDTGGEYYITVESLDGTETFTTEDLGLYISNMDRIDFLSGTPQMPGEFIYHITIPERGACPAIVYDNFLGVYDTEDLSATALSTTLCEGETATLATVERPGAYGGEYVWTLAGDSVGTGARINVVPPVGTSTYEVACGGKRMYGEFEIGDYLLPYEAFGETGYSMLKNTEITMYDYQTGYMITNVEQDSLLLMSLLKIEEVEWSQAPEMLASDDMYLPSADELGYILSNYDKFYFALEYDLPVMLSSTEKDANTVYVLNVNYARMMEYPKTELATAMGFKKIAKSEVINMVGRTSNISRTASVDIIVSERQDMAISTDDVLCNTDTANVAIETEYSVVDWYNAINPDEQVVVENGIAVLPEGSYIAVGTDEYGSCHDTLEVKVKDLAFYMPQDTTVCDSVSFTIAKEDVTVMLGDEVLDGQTFTITESGIYDIILIGIGDTCREEKTINVTVNQSYSISFDTIVLDSEFVWNGETYTATGDYEQRFTTVSGCDSIVTVHLTIVNTETEFAVYGNVTEGDGVSLLSGVNVISGSANTVTDEAGHYVIMVQRTNPILQFAKPGYNFLCDTIVESGQHNVLMLKPEMTVSLSDDSYETNPYVMRQFTVQLSNTGDGPMAWSSLVETEQTRNVMHRRNNTTMWEYADTVIRTNANAEQAIASDGYYIYTASWQRVGEFNRYSIDNGYLETFIIEGVGGIRNMTYGNGFFFATDNTNKIYKINMDSQSLEDVITLNDPDLQIRYCAYSTAEDLLYIGNWTNLYKLVAYNTAYPTLIPLSYTMDNVYSIAYDAFSGTTPCLWAFSQVSENNGPFAKIYKLNTNGIQVEGMVHYINDASLASPSSLAGGICVSQYLYDDRFVLLANVQNTNAANNIAVYELGHKNSWVSTDIKGGIIPAGGSIDVTVTEYAVENGNYTANVKFKPVVCMPEVTEVGLSMAVSTPQCSPVANLVAESDTFHTVNLSWEAVELGDYESVAYLLYEEGTEMPIDTVEATTYMVSNPEVGTHCYFVRTLMRGEADCVSEASNTACAEIEEFPCNVQLSLTARAYGDRIKLEWNALYGVEGYAVFTAEPGGEGLYIGSETMFVDTLVMPEIDYCYKVVAVFANGECQSIESNDACARIASAGCSELPVVTAKAVGNSVAISWTRVGDVQSYSLYRDGKYLTSTADTTFYDMMLDYETEYCYVVEIDCGYGNYGLSETACATTDAEVIEENGVGLLDAESFELYPNPASDKFFIEGLQMQGIQIVNFAGQVVYEEDNISDDRISIDTSDFAPGVYAVRIILSDSRSVVKRIVIGRLILVR